MKAVFQRRVRQPQMGKGRRMVLPQTGGKERDTVEGRRKRIKEEKKCEDTVEELRG